MVETLESPLDCKDFNPEYSLEGLMLKLKLQYFGHMMWRAVTHSKTPWWWERLKAKEEGDDRGWVGWMASTTWGTGVWVGSGSCWFTRKSGMLQSMGSQRVGHNWVTELNWTELQSQINRCSNQGNLLCPFVNYLIQSLLNILHACFCQYFFIHYITILVCSSDITNSTGWLT